VYVCKSVCMYVWMDGCVCVPIPGRSVYGCMERPVVSLQVVGLCKYVYVCMYACMYVCMYVYVCLCVCVPLCICVFVYVCMSAAVSEERIGSTEGTPQGAVRA